MNKSILVKLGALAATTAVAGLFIKKSLDTAKAV
jgi:hypothetical protein